MSGYAKLWSDIVMSSVWSLPDKTRIVWVTMLALKDAGGMVAGTIPGLANAARVSVEDCEKAIEQLSSTDKYSNTKTSEGRRIEIIDGGWLVVNHFKYRDAKCGDDVKSDQARIRMKRMREQKELRDSVTVVRNSVTSVSVSVSESESAEDKKGIAKGKQTNDADDTAWLAGIREEYSKIGVDVDVEVVKAKAWLSTPRGKRRTFTRQFFVNWLSRADRTIDTPKAVSTQSSTGKAIITSGTEFRQ